MTIQISSNYSKTKYCYFDIETSKSYNLNSMSDDDILSDIERIRRICREDAQSQTFERTNALIAHFAALVTTTDEAQLRNFYQLTMDMVVAYKVKVVGVYSQLRKEFSLIGPNHMSDDSLQNIQLLINSLHFQAYPTDW